MHKITYIQYTNPAAYPPLEHSSQILSGRGWDVLFLGIKSFGADSIKFSYSAKISVKMMPFCSRGVFQKIHYAQYCIWVIWQILLFNPNWVYASDPFSCPPSLILSIFLRKKIIYHEHDSPTINSNKTSAFLKFIYFCRHKLSRRAFLSILPNQQRSDIFASQMGNLKNILCVWNCPLASETKPARRSTENIFRVIYHGSIVPMRIPLTVLEALATLPDNIVLRIVGYETVGSRGYLDEIQAKAKKLGIEKKIEMKGTVSRSKLLDLCSECDLGLAFMPKHTNDINEGCMVGASNKPFEYLACGMPVLVADIREWNKVYVNDGYGLSCDPENAKDIAEKIRWFFDNPEKVREMGRSGMMRVLQEWNYESQFMPIVKILEGGQQPGVTA